MFVYFDCKARLKPVLTKFIASENNLAYFGLYLIDLHSVYPTNMCIDVKVYKQTKGSSNC